MARAYLKISVETGMEREVKSADLTTGDQDIIAVIEVGDYEALLKTIVEQTRRIKGIIGTSTSLVLD